jgi:Tol biopolymer transport system component
MMRLISLTARRSGVVAVLLLSLAADSWRTAGAAEGEARFLSQIRQLTFEGRRSGEGYFSPDGKALIFQSERDPENPFYQIFLLDLASGDSHRVSPGVGKTTCAFFRPRHDEVLFASTHLDPAAREKQKAELEFRASGKQRRYSWDYDETMDIFSARRDGSQLKRLTAAPGYDAEAAYSPDGRKIVFCSLRSAYPTNRLSAAELKRLETDPAWFGEIYIMNADGSGQKRLTDWPGYDGGPFFSPDGRRIIWRHFNEDGTVADVFTMKLDGSDRRQLTDFGCMSWAPFFHPSGEYAIFTANKLGFENFELFLVDAAGTKQPVRVTFTDGFDGLPVFSPDGQRLCWTANRTADGKSQLFLAHWNHPAARAALQAAPLRGAKDQGQRTSDHSAKEAGETSAATTHAPAPKPPVVPGKFSTEITRADLRAAVAYLADDALEGRNTGTRGAQLAAEFIAGRFRADGLAPLPGVKDFRQPFEYTAGIKTLPGKNSLTVRVEGGVVGERVFRPEEDFRPLSFTANGEFDGEVVFAGYGLKVPEGNQRGYDSYAGLDVSNKIVLVLRYVPEQVEPKRRQELNVFAGLRYKAMIARERGARAILVVTGPNSPNAGQLAPLSFDTSLSGSGILAVSVSAKVAQAILDAAGKDLKALQTALDTENPHAEGASLVPRARVRLAAGVEHIRKQDHNVIAVVPPQRRAGAPAADEYVLVGAHYDHLGHGDGSSLSRAGEHHEIHNGADDNASGTAAVLELAASFAAERKKNPAAFPRGVIFALWSGEEIGLIGSSHFAEKPPVPLSNIVAYVNFDMVGRLRDNQLSLQGVGSSSVWRKLIEKRNVAAGFNLALQDDPYLPSDTTAFYPKGVPVLHFFTGSHEDYHRPSDDTDKIEFDGLERITKFARGLIADLVTAPQRPDYVSVARSQTGGGRDQLRAYLGSIPDYAQEVEGVKLSGVRGGSPAEKGGLRGGDVIVAFAGQAIKNIYDYTYALDAVKIGQPVEIVVLRNGQRVTLTVTPEARK